MRESVGQRGLRRRHQSTEGLVEWRLAECSQRHETAEMSLDESSKKSLSLHTEGQPTEPTRLESSAGSRRLVRRTLVATGSAQAFEVANIRDSRRTNLLSPTRTLPEQSAFD